MTRTRSVVRAVRDGGGLEETALVLAATLDDPETPPAARASVARELRMTIRAVSEAKDSVVKGDVLDDLAARRAARLSSG